MQLYSPELLGPLYGLCELVISLSRRSKSASAATDRNSLRVLWIVVLSSVVLSLLTARYLPQFHFARTQALTILLVALFFLGFVLRWYSIFVLGRFFTVDVTIDAEHSLVEKGPYRYVRHPSYTGSLLMLVGFGLSLLNWLALIVLWVPVGFAFAYRIHVEEDALARALGESYRGYMARTKRLLPGVY